MHRGQKRSKADGGAVGRTLNARFSLEVICQVRLTWAFHAHVGAGTGNKTQVPSEVGYPMETPPPTSKKNWDSTLLVEIAVLNLAVRTRERKNVPEDVWSPAGPCVALQPGILGVCVKTSSLNWVLANSTSGHMDEANTNPVWMSFSLGFIGLLQIASPKIQAHHHGSQNTYRE